MAYCISWYGSKERTIDAQYFIWKNDCAGKVFVQHLLEAADRGVRVRLLVDDSMTESNPQYLSYFNAHPMVDVRIYQPFGAKNKSNIIRFFDFVSNFGKLDKRMHNKSYDGKLCIEE